MAARWLIGAHSYEERSYECREAWWTRDHVYFGCGLTETICADDATRRRSLSIVLLGAAGAIWRQSLRSARVWC